MCIFHIQVSTWLLFYYVFCLAICLLFNNILYKYIYVFTLFSKYIPSGILFFYHYENCPLSLICKRYLSARSVIWTAFKNSSNSYCWRKQISFYAMAPLWTSFPKYDLYHAKHNSASIQCDPGTRVAERCTGPEEITEGSYEDPDQTVREHIQSLIYFSICSKSHSGMARINTCIASSRY